MLSRDDIITLTLNTVVYPDGHPLAGQRDIVNAFALRHPAGLILVDTGIGAGNSELDAFYQVTRRDLASALAEHGLAPADVVAVINTHLHFDHSGENRRFAGVPIIVQAAEYAAANRPGFTIVEWVAFPGAAYRIVEGESEVVPGVRVLPTPGHTPGHQIVLVDTVDGLAVIAGQAVQTAADAVHLHRTGELPAHAQAPDRDAYRGSARRLLALAPRRVYFSHDARVWDAPPS